jgi:hypothetical protein
MSGQSWFTFATLECSIKHDPVAVMSRDIKLDFVREGFIDNLQVTGVRGERRVEGRYRCINCGGRGVVEVLSDPIEFFLRRKS